LAQRILVMKLAALVLTLAGAGLSAAAAPVPPALNTVSAGDLAQFCDGSDHVSQNVCRIYILGVTQGVVLGMGFDPHGQRTAPCVPPDLTAETLESAVKARMEAELRAAPARANEDAARFIASTLLRAYPCSHATAP
jgi:Rap1a immunity proteins